MKKTIFLMLLLFIGVASFKPSEGVNPKTKVLVYYFHLTERCHTCTTIEATVVSLLNEKYKAQLKDQTLVFKSINTDDKANEALCKEYEAYGSTLALTKLKNGKVVKKEDLTNMAFSKINKPELFKGELVEKINPMLK